ncbi:MAG: folylpolyglutamate synthase/dihydrofolate synthase family protein [Prevotella sp.]
MTYQETTEYLFNVAPVFEKIGAAAYKEGLYNSHALDAHFGHPHRQYATIHVAGTNGKGSCSHTLASILQADGYRVGLYTSPHLVDFRERIRVNGTCISEEEVMRFVEEERNFFEPLHPSFFELTTALAFKYFADQQVDIAVIEVGLGGRLDCTNIIKPILSIITNISMDHTQFLGNTLAKIAGEKAGIIKPHVPVVIGEAVPETRPVFEERAKQADTPIVFAEDNPEMLSSAYDDQQHMRVYQTRSFGSIAGDLTGDYQEKNTNTVLTAVQQLLQQQVIRHTESIKKGFSKVVTTTGLLGRWQQMRGYPTVVCDTGHNVGGWNYLSLQLKQQQCEQLRIVFGMVDDKDLDTIMEMLPKNAIYYWTQPSTKRAFPVEKITRTGLEKQLNGRPFSSVIQAYKTAMADASEKDFIFVGGSSYVVADFLASLKPRI